VHKKKKKLFNKALIAELVTSIKDQKEFWNTVHRMSMKRKQPTNDISADTWFRHFKTLLTKDSSFSNILQLQNDDDDEEDHLNRPISKEEVMFTLRKLKNRKAAGPDGIIAEFLKKACKAVSFGFLCNVFQFSF
jgi:acyl transferase domain-containing protein